jgi:hypothetical protein
MFSDSREAAVSSRLADKTTVVEMNQSSANTYFTDFDLKRVYDDYYLKRFAAICVVRWRERLDSGHKQNALIATSQYFNRHGRRAFAVWRTKRAQSENELVSLNWYFSNRCLLTFAAIIKAIKASTRERRRHKQSVHHHRQYKLRKCLYILRRKCVSSTSTSVVDAAVENYKIPIYFYRWRRHYTSCYNESKYIQDSAAIYDRNMTTRCFHVFVNNLRQLCSQKYSITEAALFFNRKSLRCALNVLQEGRGVRSKLARGDRAIQQLSRDRKGRRHQYKKYLPQSEGHFHHEDRCDIQQGVLVAKVDRTATLWYWNKMKYRIHSCSRQYVFVHAAINHWRMRVCHHTIAQLRALVKRKRGVEKGLVVTNHREVGKSKGIFEEVTEVSKPPTFSAVSDDMVMILREEYEFVRKTTETKMLHRILHMWVALFKAVNHRRFILLEKGITSFLVLITRKTVAMQMHDLGESYHTLNSKRYVLTKLKKKLFKTKRKCAL